MNLYRLYYPMFRKRGKTNCKEIEENYITMIENQMNKNKPKQQRR